MVEVWRLCGVWRVTREEVEYVDAAAEGLEEWVAREGEEGGYVGIGSGELGWEGEGLARGHL